MRFIRSLILGASVAALLTGCAVHTSTLETLLEGLAPSPQRVQSQMTSDFQLRVVNRCTGSNRTVLVYLNDRYLGNVTGIRVFRGIAPGRHRLDARGTGTYWKRYSTSIHFSGNRTWYLC